MPQSTPPRTIVTTDPELDDLNSMLRLLLYSNEIRLVGLVVSSSQFHHAGDPARGIAPHRWPAPGVPLHVEQAVDAYAACYDSLVVHDPRYPTPGYLRSISRIGNVADVGEMAERTPGADLITEVLLDDEPGKVFLQAWGGPNTIARALRTVEERYAGTPDWERVHAAVSAKAVITAFGEQDPTYAEYIAPTWPGIEFREVATMVWGYLARRVAAPADQVYLSADWMREHVSQVGPIGAAYRVWGDGIQMADGFDAEDYFGLAGLSAEELTERGYQVWCPPEPAGAWISEGDSSNFALLVDNGLRSWEHPGWGGWGGLQRQDPERPNRWSNRLAFAVPVADEPVQDTAAPWLGAVQRDLAARLRWSVTPRYTGANHAPTVEVHPGRDLTAVPGQALDLRAEVADPDGDEVTVRWWVYRDAGTYPGVVEVDEPVGSRTGLVVPTDARRGQTVHVIAEVTDAGTPAMTAYARVVVTVA